MDVAGFRTHYPAFTPELHPDVRVEFWLSVAEKQLDAGRWGDLLDHGTALFVAHNLTLEAAANRSTDGTGGMDAARGVQTSESRTVGPVSKSSSYASAAATDARAGHWSATIYGQQLHQLMMLVGAGGLVL